MGLSGCNYGIVEKSEFVAEAKEMCEMAYFEGQRDALMGDVRIKLGKSAGIVRNIQMRDYADALICFWDGKSTGTAHMIKAAESKQMKIRIIKY